MAGDGCGVDVCPGDDALNEIKSRMCYVTMWLFAVLRGTINPSRNWKCRLIMSSVTVARGDAAYYLDVQHGGIRSSLLKIFLKN